MCAPSPPPAPDYRAAAQETATGNLEAARLATKANRPNEYNPLGSRTWEQSGDDQWTSNINLTPEGQGLFDQQLRISQGMGNAAEQGLGRATEAMGNRWDSSVLPNRVNSVQAGEEGRDAVVNALMARQQPAMDRARAARETALITQGHNRGGQAWSAAQDDLNRGENDARLAAELAGGQEQSRQFGLGMQNASLQNTGRQNMLQEQMFLRNLPLNELNALRTGSQVGMPQFQAYGQQQATPGANMMGAAQAQGQYDTNVYNQGVAGSNAMMGGLFSLGGAALGAPTGTFPAMMAAMSDRRLKSNIVRVGELSGGLPVYEYDISGRREIGVMAQDVLEVKPEAVMTHPSGYLMVDYARI